MTTLYVSARKRHLLATSLATAGLMLAGGLAQAADWDVNTIYGRNSAPTAQLMAQSDKGSATVESRQGEARYSAGESTEAERVPQAYPAHASYTRDSASAPGQPALAGGSTINEENLEGTPLVEGRGMRQGVDLYAAPAVHSEPLFDVADIMGRSSPPAPEGAPNFWLRS